MTTVERAFEIARSGTVRTMNEIRSRLQREGFDAVHAHLGGTAISAQLKALMDKNRP